MTDHTPGFQYITPTQKPPRKMRVLYVEDDIQSLMLFDEMLQTRDDMELCTAQNGARGFELASHWRPDVLVLDGRLPDTHGTLLLQRMRGIPGLENTPAYMCSADVQPEHKQRAEPAGFVGCWTKPVDIDLVLGELDRLAASPCLR